MESVNMEDEVSLDPSDLGLKSYWDNFYENEQEQFDDHDDPGEIWFGQRTANAVIQWMVTFNVDRTAKILDLGCGNGMFLVNLNAKGFSNLTGIDYSAAAISLAKAVAQKRNVADITYVVMDITNENCLTENYDMCTDKGTYDAISLSPDNCSEKKEKYRSTLKSILKPGGIFVLTSCNWTKNELLDQFNDGFQFQESLPMPKFQFGGKIGQTVTSLVFKRS